MALMAKYLLGLCLGLLVCTGYGEECGVQGKGQLTTFAGEEGRVQIPCKYQLSRTQCGPYEISVVPGQAFDSKYRQYTETAWVSISRKGTDFYWKGRTSATKINRYFDSPSPYRQLYSTKDNGLTSAPFLLKMKPDESSRSVTLTVDDAAWRVVFTAYDEGDKHRRDAAGIRVICPNADYTEEADYPNSLCGNATDSLALDTRGDDLRLGSSVIKTLMHDILMNDKVVQTSPQCDAAVRIFGRCRADRSEVIKKCNDIISDIRVRVCLNKSAINPMNVFVHCLRYNCDFNDDLDSCDTLIESMDGCPKVAGVPDNC